MHQTLEAEIDSEGNVRLKQWVQLKRKHQALVIILDQDQEAVAETALLSEAALAQDWDRAEEDEAWQAYQ